VADLSSEAVVRKFRPHEYGEIHTLQDESFAGSLDFEVQTVEGGNEFLLERFKERGFPEVLLISFMSEWCSNCHYGAPELARIYDSWRDKGFGLRVVVEYSDPLTWRKDFIEKHEIDLPYVIGELAEKNESKKANTAHYHIKSLMEDQRNWGIPLHILVVGGKLEEVYYVTGEFSPGALEDFLTRCLS
tara:strand:- start:462 stop:1025 length:564 start_codon:yes stop_codon:yes gene_type:complete